MAAKTYITTVGLNYPTAKGEARVEAGETVTDLPQKSVAWLREQGLIADPKSAKSVEDAPVEDAAPVEEQTDGDA